MNRKDWFFLGFHLIKRGYKDKPQYGFILWGDGSRHTLDIWTKQTLWTIRRPHE